MPDFKERAREIAIDIADRSGQRAGGYSGIQHVLLVDDVMDALSQAYEEGVRAAHPLAKREKWHYSAEDVGLLPCPHCGPGESVVELHQDDIGYWQVGCGRCGSHSGTLPDSPHFPDAKERIVASWNKRAKAANTQSPDEEPQRGDTGTAEQREASLTHKITQEDGNG
jgi:ribosomal protein S27AE